MYILVCVCVTLDPGGELCPDSDEGSGAVGGEWVSSSPLSLPPPPPVTDTATTD